MLNGRDFLQQQRIDLDIGISAADLSVLRLSVAELRLHPAGPAASTSIRSSLSTLSDEDHTSSSALASPVRSPAKARSTTVQFLSEAANGGGASDGAAPESTRRVGRPVSAVRRKKTEARGSGGGGGEADTACDLNAVLQATAAENQRALQQAPSSSADSSTPTTDEAVVQRQSAPDDEAAAAAVPPAVATAMAPLASEEVNAAREAHCEATRARPGPSAAVAGDRAGG